MSAQRDAARAPIQSNLCRYCNHQPATEGDSCSRCISMPDTVWVSLMEMIDYFGLQKPKLHSWADLKRGRPANG